MNKKNIPGAKSMKMSADDLKEMVKQAVKECLGDEEKDLTEQDTPAVNEDIMEVIEAAVEAANEKRNGLSQTSSTSRTRPTGAPFRRLNTITA